VNSLKARVEWKDILSYDFMKERQGVTAKEIAAEVGCSTRTVQRARARHGLYYQPSLKGIKILRKREKRDLSFSDLKDAAKQIMNIRKGVESKQTEVTVEANDEWIGIAIFGDLHFGAYEQDIETIEKHTELVSSTKNCFAVQVGDLTDSQSSFTHRGSRRMPPFEFDLDVQRKMVFMWVESIANSLLAIIIGNHDQRAIISEKYDIGEEVVDKIKGAYLGYNGVLTVKFPSGVEYHIMICHEGKGYSMWNPNHSGRRVLAENTNLDAVVNGHIHDGVAVQDIALGGYKRAVLVRASDYTIQRTKYAWQTMWSWVKPETPILLLNPRKKQILPFVRLEDGIKILKVLNNE